MAAANGGNCELTVPGEVTETDNGVKIIGYTDLAGRLPAQSSQLYGQNIVNLFKLVTPGKDGRLVLDMDDEIVRGITVTQASATGSASDILWPPPPVKVSAAPAPAPAAATAAAEAEEEEPKGSGLWWKIVAGALVAEAAMRHLGIEQLQMCPWALREGVILRRADAGEGVSGSFRIDD